MSGTPPIVTEAMAEIHRLDEVIEEAKTAGPQKRRLTALVESYGFTVNGKNGKKSKATKQPRMVWYKRPKNCILPAAFHTRGVDRTMTSKGLCTSHVHRLNAGTLTEAENEAYDDALVQQRNQGNLA